jgi:hypothetical protein
MCLTDLQNQKFSHARMAGINMRINNTIFSIRGGTFNNIFALTSVPDEQYDPYKNQFCTGVHHETPIESWIWRRTIYHTINHPSRTRTEIPLTYDGITGLDNNGET